MKRMLRITCMIAGLLLLPDLCVSVHAESAGCRTCDAVQTGSPPEVRIKYQDGSERAACGLRCAGAILAAYREKDVEAVLAREYRTGDLLDAKKAFWVIGLSDDRMEAFSGRPEAVAFSAAHGGRVVHYGEMMTAVFSGMYDGIRKSKSSNDIGPRDDMDLHPECVYCGMDRKQYAHSRVLLRYTDGSEAGLCSLHCAGLDLALHPEKATARIMVGAYNTGSLVDAEKAVWVLGGSKQGVMSIRGKWAFGKREEAAAFIRDFGGGFSNFRDVMTAVFEDMWAIIR